MNKKKIFTVTFFHKNVHEKHIFLPIAKELKNKGINSIYSKNMSKKAYVGFYCEKPPKINAKISAVFLEGIDHGRTIWPNIWKNEPWNDFDLGFLPGDSWVNRWKKCAHDSRSQTKYGVFKVGWTKSDFLFNSKLNKKKITEFQKKYGINRKGINILYAPSFECFDRQIEVAKIVKRLGLNLIIKHWLVKKEKKYVDLWNNIKRSNKETLNIYKKKTKIIKPEENFLILLNFADLVVTDESSVAYEALLKNIPTISVVDWKMQRHNKAKSRFVKPSSIVFKTTKKKLSNKISELIKKKKKIEKKLEILRKKEFSNLGYSSKIIVNILLDFMENKSDVKNSEYICKTKTKKKFFKRILEIFKV